MTTRDELAVALAGRYALGSRADRGRMLDEFAALTGLPPQTREAPAACRPVDRTLGSAA